MVIALAVQLLRAIRRTHHAAALFDDQDGTRLA
jgi:hypothetical protein